MMNKVIKITFGLMLAGSTVFAQKLSDTTKKSDVKDELFGTAEEEVVPEFPGGGQAAFSKFLSKNYRYPNMAREQGVSGKVIMSFVVEKDGSLTNIKVLRDLGLGTGEEAVRLLKSSPKWKPGTIKGRPVSVAYTLPITLHVEAENSLNNKKNE
ncbi:MAG: energy transducer TonB [Daejeonella sp.]